MTNAGKQKHGENLTGKNTQLEQTTIMPVYILLYSINPLLRSQINPPKKPQYALLMSQMNPLDKPQYALMRSQTNPPEKPQYALTRLQMNPTF